MVSLCDEVILCLASEQAESVAVLELLAFLALARSSYSAFLFPSDPSCVSFAVLFGVFRIGNLLLPL